MTATGTPAAEPRRQLHVEPVMGTVVSIDVRDAAPAGTVQAAVAAVVADLHAVDRDFSTYRPGSWVSRLQAGAVTAADCPAQVREVLGLCARYRDDTGGWFDPAYAGPGRWDPTGLVKGWAVARAVALLAAYGLRDLCVTAGGDVLALGRPAPGRAWRIGVTDPRRPPGLLGSVTAPPGGGALAVATSGVQERGEHVLDPRTHRAAAGLLSATVIGTDLIAADAWATAVLAAGPDGPALAARLRAGGCAWITMAADGSVRRSPPGATPAELRVGPVGGG